MSDLIATIQLRSDTAANWTSSNPKLKSTELGIETDTFTTSGTTRLFKCKLGDGSTAWNSLSYANIGQFFAGGSTSFGSLTGVPSDNSALQADLNLKENNSNKAQDFTDPTSTTKFPVIKAVVDYIASLTYVTASYVTSALATFKTDNFLDATSSIQTQLNESIGQIHISTQSTPGSPADGVTYFHGERTVVFTQNSTSISANNIYVPSGCTKLIYARVVYNTQNVGSNENLSAYLRLNNTTDTLISSDIDMSNQIQIREYTTPITGLTPGVDSFQVKTVCPSWLTTNPTSVTVSVVLKFMP